MKRILTWLLLAGALPALAQYSVYVFDPITLTATSQTSAQVQLPNSYASGTITLTGTSLTTATFAVQGCAKTSCASADFVALATTTCGDTAGTYATTQTATANACYRVNLAGMTNIRYVTSGTFTGTSIALTLTGSPNAQLSKGGGGGGAFNPAAPGAIGGTTPGSGAFTTLTSSLLTGLGGTTSTDSRVNIAAGAVTGTVGYGIQSAATTGASFNYAAKFGDIQIGRSDSLNRIDTLSGQAILFAVAPAPSADGGVDSGATNFRWRTTFTNIVTMTPVAISALPAAATAGDGAIKVVNDSATTVVGTCTGGGSNRMIALSNGTTWVCR